MQPEEIRAAQRRAVFELWLVNVALGMAIGQAFFDHAPQDLELRVRLFLQLGLLTTLVLISLPIVALTRIAVCAKLPALAAGTAALAWTLFQVLLLADTRVYNMFRYHFNGMVWNVLTTPGSGDAVHLDAWFWSRSAAIAGALALAEYGLWRWRIGRLRTAGVARSRLARPAIVLGLVFAPSALIEKALYAHADLVRDREIVSLARLIPFYPRLTVKRLARGWFGYELEKRARVVVAREGVLLRYPHEMPRRAPDAPRPNVVMIVVESLRADMLDEEVMPSLWHFARGGRRFQDHASGGNATRHGLFSLLYGLHGSYWRPVLAEQRSPVLVDAMLDAGYRAHVLSTASMSYPELRSTAWVRIEDEVEDRLDSAPGESRDARLVARWERWTEAQEAHDDQPFFLFAFLDAPHQTYTVPPDCHPFEPYARDIDYIELSGAAASERAPEVFNRYRNAVHDCDRSIARMLAALERAGELENSIVVVTGDHGEEFYEHGFWGHTSNFTREQVLVPLVLRGPGVPLGLEERPTSHVDVAVTLLELLGADPRERASWSQGESLLAPPATRQRVIAGWDQLALWVSDGVIVLPIDAYRGMIEAYDPGWKPVDEEEAFLRAAAPSLGDLAADCRAFLR